MPRGPQRFAPPRSVQTDSHDMQELARSGEAATRMLSKDARLQGRVYLPRVALTGGTNRVRHPLRRVPHGWSFTDTSGDGQVHIRRTTWDQNTITLEVSDGTGTQAAKTAAESARPDLIPIPLTSFLLLDGTPLTVFAPGASPTPGLSVLQDLVTGFDEAVCIRWNNHATPDTICARIPMPVDLTADTDISLHFLCAKNGNDADDSTTIDVAAYFQSVGAKFDADSVCGGTTNALVGNAAATTVDELIVTIPAVDVVAPPSSLFFKVTPTAGLLDTDDLFLFDVWLECQRSPSTSASVSSGNSVTVNLEIW